MAPGGVAVHSKKNRQAELYNRPPGAGPSSSGTVAERRKKVRAARLQESHEAIRDSRDLPLPSPPSDSPPATPLTSARCAGPPRIQNSFQLLLSNWQSEVSKPGRKSAAETLGNLGISGDRVGSTRFERPAHLSRPACPTAQPSSTAQPVSTVQPEPRPEPRPEPVSEAPPVPTARPSNPVDRSVDHPVDRTVDRSVDHPVDRTVDHSVDFDRNFPELRKLPGIGQKNAGKQHLPQIGESSAKVSTKSNTFVEDLQKLNRVDDLGKSKITGVSYADKLRRGQSSHPPPPQTHKPSPQTHTPRPSPAKFFEDILKSNKNPLFPIKPPATHNGKPAIFISREEINAMAEPLRFSLVGRFETNRPSLFTIRQFIRMLRPTGQFWVTLLDERHVLIRLDAVEDYARLWRRKSYSVFGKPMRVSQWTPEFRGDEDSPVVPLWISLPHLPVHYIMCKEFLYSLASSIGGSPICVDSATASNTRTNVARLMMEFDISRPLVPEIFVGEDDTGYYQEVIYEEVPSFCTRCRLMGHLVDSCPTIISDSRRMRYPCTAAPSASEIPPPDPEIIAPPSLEEEAAPVASTIRGTDDPIAVRPTLPVISQQSSAPNNALSERHPQDSEGATSSFGSHSSVQIIAEHIPRDISEADVMHVGFNTHCIEVPSMSSYSHTVDIPAQAAVMPEDTTAQASSDYLKDSISLVTVRRHMGRIRDHRFRISSDTDTVLSDDTAAHDDSDHHDDYGFFSSGERSSHKGFRVGRTRRHNREKRLY